MEKEVAFETVPEDGRAAHKSLFAADLANRFHSVTKSLFSKINDCTRFRYWAPPSPQGTRESVYSTCTWATWIKNKGIKVHSNAEVGSGGREQEQVC